jgi:hypothetical protein
MKAGHSFDGCFQPGINFWLSEHFSSVFDAHHQMVVDSIPGVGYCPIPHFYIVTLTKDVKVPRVRRLGGKLLFYYMELKQAKVINQDNQENKDIKDVNTHLSHCDCACDSQDE